MFYNQQNNYYHFFYITCTGINPEKIKNIDNSTVRNIFLKKSILDIIETLTTTYILTKYKLYQKIVGLSYFLLVER